MFQEAVMMGNSRRIQGLFLHSTAVIFAAFIVVLAGCEAPNEPKVPLQIPVVNDFDISGLAQTYDGTPKSVTITPKEGKSGGDITVYYNGRTDLVPSALGSYTVLFDVGAAPGWKKASGLFAGIMTIMEPVNINFIRLKAGEWSDGNISSRYDEQKFTFTATGETQYIYFKPGNLSSVSLQLYDSSGNAVGNKTNLAPYSRYGSWTLISGNEYTIRVTPNTEGYIGGFGDYKIGFNAFPVSPDTSIPVLGPDTWLDGNIGYNNSEQWFTFSATAETQYIHFTPGTLNKVFIQLYDSTGVMVGEQTNLSDSALYVTRTLTTGTKYYVRVTNYNTNSSGSYKIGFNISVVPPAVPTVITLSYNTWEDGNIAASGGEQWFIFTATADIHYIHFYPGSLSSVYVQLFDSNGAAVGFRENLHGSAPYTSRTLTTGSKYYIKVTPYNGNTNGGSYTILFNVSRLSDNTVATVLNPDTWTDGDFSGLKYENWYKFTAIKETQYIHFESDTLNGIYLQLYDADGKPKGEDIKLTSSIRYTSVPVTTGNEYYIRVTRSGNGSYYKIGLNVLFIPPGINIAKMSANIWEEGNIAGSDGFQWFKFTATAGTQYIHFEPGYLKNVYVEMYDSTGVMVGERTNLSGSALYTSRTLITGNEYYFKVTPYSGSGLYRIAFNNSSTQPSIIPVSNITTISADTWANGEISSGKEQWFKFSATSDAQYIHFLPEYWTDIAVYLFDSNGAAVGSAIYFSGSMRYSLQSLTSGRDYYIRVGRINNYSGSSSYKIGFNKFIIPPETNVTTISANTWINGNIAPREEQWFKFSAETARQFIHFRPDTLTVLDIQLFDTSGAMAGTQTRLSYITPFIPRTLTTGNEYYIRVSPGISSSGAYKLLLSSLFILSSDITVTTINADTWESGNIAVSGGEQWFKFNATSNDQFIHFESVALSDVYIQLYNSTGESSGGWTNLSGSNPYTLMTLTTGYEYYIRVTSGNNSGAYKLLFNKLFLPSDIIITTIEDSAWTDGNIAVMDGVQWFKFTAKSAAQNLYFNSGSLNSVYVQLYNAFGRKVESQTNMSASMPFTPRSLTNGTEYYVKVTPGGAFTGTYKIGVAPVTTLGVNAWADGNIAGSDSLQWFKFTATAATQYIHFDPNPLGSVNVQLYNASGAAVVGGYGYLSDSDLYISRSLTTNAEYYIKVTPGGGSGYGSGSYRIGFTASSTVLPSIINLPTLNVTQLAFDTWSNGNVNSGGEQWFKFTATVATQYIHFVDRTLSSAYVYVYDSNGLAVGVRTELGSNNNTLYTNRSLTIGNVYYIRVTPTNYYGNGNYRIGFNFLPAPPDTNITTISAANTWANGTISSGKEQWFKFTATSEIHFIHFGSGTLSAAYVQLYNTNGATVGNETNIYNNYFTSRSLTSGAEYYIRVKPSSGSGGTYKIAFNTSETRPQ